MRIADLYTSRGDNCPTGWREITTPDSTTYPSKVACQPLNNSAWCFPTNFTVNGASYYKICGKVRGYQFFTPDAFAPSAGGGRSINDVYVDDLSIMIGEDRKLYAVGVSNGKGHPRHPHNCSCSDLPGTSPPNESLLL